MAMLRIERSQCKLTTLSEARLSDSGLQERSGLQELILKNPVAFFEQECKEVLFVVREEVQPSTLVENRIDLLAIDEDGKVVIVELKLGSSKLHLLQSLTYAAMISDWALDEFERALLDKDRPRFTSFLSEHGITEQLNESQRIILVAESFGFEVLKTASWLTDSYGFNISCYQVSIAHDTATNSEYLSAIQVFPPKELAPQVRRRGSQRSGKANKAADIEQLLATCKDEQVVSFFKNNIGLRRNKRGNALVFPQIGKMRFRVRPKGDYAHVVQLGKFDGDEALWQADMSAPDVKVRARDLIFRLKTTADFDRFMKFVQTDMRKIVWTKSLVEDDEEETEGE